MRHTALALCLVFAWAVSPLQAAAPERLEYSGYYEWNLGGRGRLDVTFFPDGHGDWEVTLRFEHARRFQTWKGTAIGELGSGSLEGLVRGGRYRFHGSFEDGVFRGTHFEVTRRGLREGGTLQFE